MAVIAWSTQEELTGISGDDIDRVHVLSICCAMEHRFISDMVCNLLNVVKLRCSELIFDDNRVVR